MIRDLQLGNAMEQPCLVRLQKVGTSSNGKPYAKGLLEDNSGCIPFICFEAGPIGRLRTMEAPTPYIIGGKVDVNKYSTTMAYQVIVQKVQAVTEEDDLSDLLPSGHIDLEKYKMEFQAFMGRIQDDGLRELVETLFFREHPPAVFEEPGRDAAAPCLRGRSSPPYGVCYPSGGGHERSHRRGGSGPGNCRGPAP